MVGSANVRNEEDVKSGSVERCSLCGRSSLRCPCGAGLIALQRSRRTFERGTGWDAPVRYRCRWIHSALADSVTRMKKCCG